MIEQYGYSIDRAREVHEEGVEQMPQGDREPNCDDIPSLFLPPQRG